MNKKGFLFVVTVFLILTYILFSVRVWVKSIESSERLYSEFYKESNVELIMDQVTHEKVDEVSNAILNRALYRLTEISKDNTFKAGGDPGSKEEFRYIEMAFRDFLVNGTLSNESFDSKKAPPPESGSSLLAWVSRLNASLDSAGVYVSEFKVSKFKIQQSDMRTLNYSFTAYLSLKDRSGTTSLSRTYIIANNVTIDGLVDPAVYRASKEKTATSKNPQPISTHQFFFYEQYSEPSKLAPIRLSVPSGVEGQGWFYGPIVKATAKDTAAIKTQNRHLYIVYGQYDEIMKLKNPDYLEFGAVIITNAPISTQVTCTEAGKKYTSQDKTFWPIRYSSSSGGKCAGTASCTTFGDCPQLPYMVYPGFKASNAADCPDLSDLNSKKSKKCVLMLSTYDYQDVHSDVFNKQKAVTKNNGGLYNLENLRDFMGCGYYTHNKYAPSYLQRLFKDTYSKRNHSEFGIESFVIGEYSNHTRYDTYSRVDRKLFNSSSVNDKGILIRGMPGCKGNAACSGEPSTGKFALDKADIKTYLGKEKEIACDTMARCN